MMTLDKVPVGKRCRVKRVTADGTLRRRLFDMGVTVNTEIYVRKVAPLGDPIEVTLRGYELSIRKSEAECILTEELDA